MPHRLQREQQGENELILSFVTYSHSVFNYSVNSATTDCQVIRILIRLDLTLYAALELLFITPHIGTVNYSSL
jgi:hypothetical protein